jgi:integrase
MPLTDTACRNAKAKEKPYKLTDSEGMYLEVMPNGSKYWRLKYRHLGKEKRLAFGVYPDVGLSDAREKRLQARKLLSNGTDPGAVKQTQKQQAIAEAENTFEKVTRLWLEKKKRTLHPKYAKHIQSRIEKDLINILGPKHVDSITSKEIIAALQKVETRGAYELVRRLKQNCAEIYRFAVVHDYAKTNPASAFESKDIFGKYETKHYPSLEPSDIPAFLAALSLNKPRLYRQTVLAIELMMLTFVRTGELIQAKWVEINWKEKQWEIPAERMKMKRPHIVPLSSRAIAILKELQEMNGHRDYIFPGMNDPRQCMSNGTILHALKALGYHGRMTGHGFRALAMTTIKEKLGYRHEVVDRQLAHAPKNKIDAAYDRAKFLPERAKMMQEWARYIEGQRAKGSK